VTIQPKVDAAAVFRMLGYVFTDNHRHLLQDAAVQYASESPLFEPLINLFNKLVSARAKRGLVQDYIRRNENFGVFRGALDINKHVQQNLGRDNRVHCRFFEQTVDVLDNRLIKATLWRLLQCSGWSSHTTQALIRNLHRFDPVTLQQLRPQAWANMHYHRLNDDYRPIHELCRMFLAYSSISEKEGSFAFRGFLLDMNRLFEQFIQTAFEQTLRRSHLQVDVQRCRQLSLNPTAPNMRPDVTVRNRENVVVIADAKYKTDESGSRNPDIYQVIAYGTVLQCDEVFLLYPALALNSDIDVINSPIVVKSRRVDISSLRAVENIEALVGEIAASKTLARVDQVP